MTAPSTPPTPVCGSLGPAPATPGADGLRACVQLPPDDSACGAARRTTRQVLAAWRVLDEERVHDVLLVVSELVGNAVRHGEQRVVLDLCLQGDAVQVGVVDGAPQLPRQRQSGEDSEGGRGLSIVAALARAWGAQPLPGGGKRVWAVLPV